jgi:hypothetical protein
MLAITVYRVSPVGVAFGFFALLLSSVDAGVQLKYKASPEGFRVMVSPRQIVESLPGFSVTLSTTFTVTESELIQPDWSMVALYVVVVFGKTRGLGESGLIS